MKLGVKIMAPPKRVVDRIVKSASKFQKILQDAKNRDVGESDTVSIVKDMLDEIFGYDKYQEITSEFAIRGTYCDLAIKIENKIEFLIEVKAIGKELKESHLRQAINYGANNGIQWIILTNGICWQVYRIRFEKPINYDLDCAIDFIQIDGNSEEDLEKIFIICKEGINKDAREDLHEKIQCLNRFILGALILSSDEVISIIRRELKKVTDGIRVEPEEIIKVLENEVLKRDVIEGEDAQKAQNRVKRFYTKLAKQTSEESIPVVANSSTGETKAEQSTSNGQLQDESHQS
jgi:hypothetical protein